MKEISIFIIFLLSLFLATPKAHADENFINSFDITYTVNGNGITHAVFAGTIQNATDRYYASSYTLQVGFQDMHAVQATDIVGAITPVIHKTATGESIQIPFNKHAVGINNAVTFSLAFDSADIAKHVGGIWEINIPGLANQSEFKDFTVHLRVPTSFGKPSYIKPQQNDNSLDFDKSTLGSAGISLAFGAIQNYNFSLAYHLKNDNLFPIKSDIALPPTTNYQTVTVQDISPKPLNVALDTDGNWIATYYLFPSEQIHVVAKGKVQVALVPRKEIVSPANQKLYLSEEQYWEVNNTDIQSLAQDLKTPHEIFAYVVGHLQYDFSRVAGKQERLGAKQVLANPSSAVCLEFTDLFIAIARAAGIPAREIDGYAYTQNSQERPLSQGKDILHAWPEYYDAEQGTWIAVDPTWQNTTKGTDYFYVLDFDHVAFDIKGAKSTYPIPAGGYKLNTSTGRDVLVSFAQDFPADTSQVTVAYSTPPTLFSGLPVTGTVTIRNVGQTLVPGENLLITSHTLFPHKQILTSIAIPPFGSIDLPVGFKKTSFLTNAKETITIQVGGNTITKEISLIPFFLKPIVIIGGIIFVIFCIVLLIVTTGAWRLSIFRR